MATDGASRTLFIGDVHGCAQPLAALLEALGYDPARDRLYLTGDAFSRGPDPLGVWALIRATGAEMVLGNHDDWLVRLLEDRLAGGSLCREKDKDLALVEALWPVAADVLAWLKARPLAIDAPDFLLVHAGIHPKLGLAGTDRAQRLTIRLWPPAKGIVGPRWHDFLTPLDKPVIFGHDAPGGLVVKRRADGAPVAIGLDSGCVYGKALSAYVLEEDRIVQVPGWSASPWRHDFAAAPAAGWRPAAAPLGAPASPIG